MVQRVKSNALINCPQCDNPTTLIETQYGIRNTCHKCNLWAWGINQKPVDGETHHLRKKCHAIFDPLWKKYRKKVRKRKAMYGWLSRELGIPREKMHFKLLEKADLRRALEVIPNIPDNV